MEGITEIRMNNTVAPSLKLLLFFQSFLEGQRFLRSRIYRQRLIHHCKSISDLPHPQVCLPQIDHQLIIRWCVFKGLKSELNRLRIFPVLQIDAPKAYIAG